jgi:hypothetical protein
MRGFLAQKVRKQGVEEKLLGPKDRALASEIADRLGVFSETVRDLPGAPDVARRSALALQIVESIRRERYMEVIRKRPWAREFADPDSDRFDPLKGAIYHYKNGNVDEAFWLVFLSVHFGKHVRDGWRLARDIYRGDGARLRWDWARVSNNPAAFHEWLKSNLKRLKSDGVKRRFGNHRKYETLRTNSARGTAQVFKSYVKWVGANRGHELFFSQISKKPPLSEAEFFEALYRSLDAVVSFGRTAKFDLLGMLNKIGFLPIVPSIPYLEGATGPLKGARLLFTNSIRSKKNAKTLTPYVVELGKFLNVNMRVMEDALCNWQKSPSIFLPFRG